MSEAFTHRIYLTAGVTAAVMAASLAYGIGAGDLRADAGALVRNPWALVTLVEAYAGFTLVSLWIGWREGSAVRGLAWMALIFALGNLVTAMYLFAAARTSRGDPRRFWLGEGTCR